MIRFLLFCLLFTICATASSKSVGQTKSDLEALARQGDASAIKNYFKENGTYGKDSSDTTDYFLFFGDSENQLGSIKFAESLKKDNNSIEEIKSRCNSQPSGIGKLKCLGSFPAPCLFKDHQHESKCTIYEEVGSGNFMGKFKIANETNLERIGPLTSDLNLKWYLEALKESFAASNSQREKDLSQQGKDRKLQNDEEQKWIRFCKTTKRKLISKATIVPVSKFESNSFWSEVQGLNLNPHCLSAKDKVENYFGICRHDERKGCAVVEGLPAGSNSSSIITEFIAFYGFTRGKTIQGFEVREVPVWKVVPHAELQKAGLKAED